MLIFMLCVYCYNLQQNTKTQKNEEILKKQQLACLWKLHGRKDKQREKDINQIYIQNLFPGKSLYPSFVDHTCTHNNVIKVCGREIIKIHHKVSQLTSGCWKADKLSDGSITYGFKVFTILNNLERRDIVL